MRSRGRGAAAFSFIAGTMLLLSALALPQVMAASTTTSSTTTTVSSPTQSVSAAPASLALSLVPSELPADGGSYPAIVVSLESSSGADSIALNDTLVFLSSSLAGVGSVSAQVTIQRGADFAVANFTTTQIPGTTSVSASSIGLNSSSVHVTTVTPTGVATQLGLIAVPGTQLVDASGQGVVLVEALDSAGLPARVSSDVFVTLSSSDDSVVSLPSNSVTLSGGSGLALAPYEAGTSPGSATITGSASGLDPGSYTVTMQGSPAFALKIFAQPDPITTSTSGRLVLTLVDSQGDPVAAPSAVAISISSSNTTVIATDQTATIPAGQIYADANLNSGPIPGTANLTASSPGLRSDFALMTVVYPAQPVDLKLIVAPNPVLANARSYGSIIVALTDASGNPAIASSSVAVTLTSSNAAVGTVGSSVVIQPGSSYAVASFSSTFAAGSTFITALAQNLQSVTTTVSSYGTVPVKVAVQALLPNLPADGGSYPAIEVSLEDSGGLLAVALANTAVQLASSNPGVANVNSSILIGAGQSYVIAYVGTTPSGGEANITASTSAYGVSSTKVVTTSPAPSQLGLYVGPSNGLHTLEKGGDAILAVQLQDSKSLPATSLEDTQVVITGSNDSVIAKPIDLDIPPGADLAWAYVNASQPGQVLLTASASGLSSANASLSEASVPVLVTLTSSVPDMSVGATATVQVLVTVSGAPVAGANVTLTATSGLLGAPGGVTNSAGQFVDTFVAKQDGVATVTAVVQDPLLGTQTTETNILITPLGGLGTGGGLGILGSILPIVLVLVIVVIIVLGARRIIKARRSGAGEDEDKGFEAP